MPITLATRICCRTRLDPSRVSLYFVQWQCAAWSSWRRLSYRRASQLSSTRRGPLGFGRLKDFRRIATRYDKLAGNDFSRRLVAIGTWGL
jgi:transposase